MHKRLTKESVKVVKAKSTKLQGARASVRARRRILQIFTSHAVTLRKDVQRSRKTEDKNDGEKLKSTKGIMIVK